MSTLKNKIITVSNKILTYNNKIVTGCGPKYVRARFCPSPGAVSTVGMTVLNAAIIGTQAFSLAGVCYYFNLADAPTGTAPATLTTPGAVTTFLNCAACIGVTPPDDCTGCINECYRIAGYVDGDFVPLAAFVGCDTTRAILEAINPALVQCNGTVTYPTPAWDGRFRLTSTVGPLPGGSGTCEWVGTCDNLPWVNTGNSANGNVCVSGALVGGNSFDSIQIVKVCSGGSISGTPFLRIVYYYDSNHSRTLWQGTGPAGIVGTWTRTGGDDTTATLTIERCP